MMDIELVTTDEIFEELCRRFNHCIFCGLNERSDDEVMIVRKISGNSHTCAGLAYEAAHFAIHGFHGRAQSESETQI
jgi:hypothetical protein